MKKPPPNQSMRIQKYLAHQGVASRRTIEQWLTLGRIKINGQVATLGMSMTANDHIMIDGQILKLQAGHVFKRRVLLLHKPEGMICTRNDPEHRPTIFSLLPQISKGRWIGVGRLDINTAGLMILTTDGDLAHRLMHPSYEIEREYAVRVLGKLPESVQSKMLEGIMLEDGMAKFKSIVDAGGQGRNHWYHVILTEGRQREIRRLFQSQDIILNRLIRVRFGPISLPSTLRKGKYIELEDEQIQELFFSSRGISPNR